MVDDFVKPLLLKDYSSITEIEEDIEAVSKVMISAAYATIPQLKKENQHTTHRHVKDPILSNLCWQSRVAFRDWKNAGRPPSGPLYSQRKDCKRKVSDYLSKCRARLERKEIGRRDKLFRSRHPKCFKTWSSRTQGSTLAVNGSRVTDTAAILEQWADHFSRLGASRCASNPNLDVYVPKVAELEAKSYSDNDSILDCPIVVEEVFQAINRLKRKSVGGADSLSPCHLKFGGPLLRDWLCTIFNAILSMEFVPSSFKFGVITPVYKGKGKDPLSCSSYRGITLTSVLAKTLEFILLERMLPVLSDLNIPYKTQTAFQKGLSCSDAIFSCQEAISKYIREGDSVYSCFYDLASAFDTVEYPVLLDHMWKCGIVGKCWRVIKNWYSNSSSCVRINGSTSRSFSINRGVKQGSVLSPFLFLFVMDPILLTLKNKFCGLNICGLYLGAFCHADDVRTLASSKENCSSQISDVSDFAASRGLSLNVDKCDAVISPHLKSTPSSLSGNDLCITVTSSARCLGAWWTSNLSSTIGIEKNIKKSRNAFFAKGKDLFHGKLNPLSSKSIVECCIMPILLYGAESWLLNSTLVEKLESFQAELAKRVLRLQPSASNRACRLALHWPSMRARVLCSKLSYLLKLMLGNDSISCQVFRSLAASNVEEILLVRQCRFLESCYGSNITTEIISNPMSLSTSAVKRTIVDLDFVKLKSEIGAVPVMKHLLDVETNKAGSWLKVWDFALDYGPSGTSSALALLKLLCLKFFSNKCPIKSCGQDIGENLAGEHFISTHTSIDASLSDCVASLENCSTDILKIGQALQNSFLNCGV